MTYVTDRNNQAIPFELAVSMMDDDIREALHAKYAGDVSEQMFYNMYVQQHEAKYHQEFTL